MLRYQQAMIQLSAEAAVADQGIPNPLRKAIARWSMWGGIATLLPLLSLYLMVARPALWN